MRMTKGLLEDLVSTRSVATSSSHCSFCGHLVRWNAWDTNTVYVNKWILAEGEKELSPQPALLLGREG